MLKIIGVPVLLACALAQPQMKKIIFLQSQCIISVHIVHLFGKKYFLEIQVVLVHCSFLSLTDNR